MRTQQSGHVLGMCEWGHVSGLGHLGNAAQWRIGGDQLADHPLGLLRLLAMDHQGGTSQLPDVAQPCRVGRLRSINAELGRSLLLDRL